MDNKKNILVGTAAAAGIAALAAGMVVTSKNCRFDKSCSYITEDEGREKFLIGSLLGGAAGLLMAMLFAPQSGQDLRDNILKHLRSAKVKAMPKVKKIKKNATQAKSTLKKKRPTLKSAKKTKASTP